MRETLWLVPVVNEIGNMGILQNYINTEESDEQAKDNNRVDLQYTGTLKHLRDSKGKGKKGKGYYIVKEDLWYFTPNDDSENEYRVKAENLNFIGGE